MISKIGPLVEVGERGSTTVHLLGSLVGAALSGFILATAGLALHAIARTPVDFAFTWGVPVALAYLAAADLGFGAHRELTVHRQTPGSWPCEIGVRPALFAWGADLGACITTRLAYQSIWAVPLVAVLSHDIGLGILVMMSFGFGRGSAVLIQVERAHGEFATVCTTLAASEARRRRTVGTIALLGACVLVVFRISVLGFG